MATRPPRPGNTTKTIDLSIELYEAVMKTAEADERDFSKQCRVLLREALTARHVHLPREPKNPKRRYPKVRKSRVPAMVAKAAVTGPTSVAPADPAPLDTSS